MPVTKGKASAVAAGVVAAAVAVFAAYTWVSLNWSYSRGTRAGYVQKFSQKGWLVKTWEGELQMVPIPGATPEKFLFSVRDQGVAQKVTAAMGRRVTLTYEQHKGVPTSFFGETEYYVTGVVAVE
ncbi:MAG TPA: hypothetical protein VNX25_00315 [Verrucomicrobiae bacterium]|nr:hypothetical protein [Verrucomicrobiae bacterium]